MIMGCAIFTIFFIFVAIKTGINIENSYRLENSGRLRNIYFLPLIISILSWITYFGLSVWGVFYGALNHRRSILNISILFLGIGIFTRFIDLIERMMPTGMMFISCGILLFVIGFALEKWRKNLIQTVQGDIHHG